MVEDIESAVRQLRAFLASEAGQRDAWLAAKARVLLASCPDAHNRLRQVGPLAAGEASAHKDVEAFLDAVTAFLESSPVRR